MTKKAKQSIEEQITEYFNKLDHPLKNVVEELREIILKTDKEIAEQIKWNSPSFYYMGKMKPFDPKEYKRDIVVFNLHKKEFVLLVFPTGAVIEDKTGLLEGKFADSRKTVKFSNFDEVKEKEKDLQMVIKQWLSLIDK